MLIRGWRGLRGLRGLLAAVVMALAWLALPPAQAQSTPSAQTTPSTPTTPQPVPPLTGRVIDTTGVLSASARAAMDGKLAALERDKGAQVVVLVVPSTAPEDIGAYANRVGNAWKIGRKNVGDGLIVLVALQDRQARIEVAKTLEGAVPDIAASHIIEDAIIPAFRRGDYAGGLNAALDQIGARIRGEPLPPVAGPSAAQPSGNAVGGTWWSLAALFLIGLPLVNALVRLGLTGASGAMVAGAVMGGGAWGLTGNPVIAILGALLTLMVSLFADALASSPAVGRRYSGGDGGGPAGAGPVFLPDIRRRGGGLGNFGNFGNFGGESGSGRSGGFRSGGGGNFGGGGASGGW